MEGEDVEHGRKRYLCDILVNEMKFSRDAAERAVRLHNDIPRAVQAILRENRGGPPAPRPAGPVDPRPAGDAPDALINPLVSQLMEMGFPREDSERAAQRNSGIDSAIRDLRGLAGRKEPERKCCLEDSMGCGPHKASDIYIVGVDPMVARMKGECECCLNVNHVYCFDCLWLFIREQIADGLVPACPGSRYMDMHSEGCGGPDHGSAVGACGVEDCRTCGLCLLSQTTVEQIMNEYFKRNGGPEDDVVAHLRLSWGNLTYAAGQAAGVPNQGWRSERLDKACKLRAVERIGAMICCPAGHEVAIYPRHLSGKFSCHRAECQYSQAPFCSACNMLFHHDIPCGELAHVTEEWVRWCEAGRAAYLAAVAATNAAFQAALQAFEGARKNHEEDLQTHQRNLQQMQADEEWKVQNCKLCPNCHRVVQHMGGCDAMVCGQNYHGGEVQNGCGMRYNWGDALPYQGHAEHAAQAPRFDAQPPAELQKVRHFITKVPEMPRLCDICGQAVEGPLIKCVNCPGFGVCISCDARNNIMSTDIRLRSGEVHPKGHVFRVITTETIG
eukprot:CAMPEP_0117548626 /NCGR_PEP_ID=MMETSP0784-20121206/47747_1 /TAXON_ID=39447 /ORGANISM="" /LENGTH=556 /DNA_ID=CAMNT_0005345589 /DNA_START=1 /DNA_END=1671 /DNA_ORIENTATION=+